MKNKKNFLLVFVMLLGATTFGMTEAYAMDEDLDLLDRIEAQEEIRANKESLHKAEEFINKKEFESALPYLNAYIESKPKKYLPYKLRGEVYYALRQYNIAVQDFQTAVDIKTADDKFATNTKVISAVVLGADKQEQYQNPELGSLYGELMYAQKAINNSLYEVSYKKALEYNSHLYLPAPKKEDIAKINCPQKYGKAFNAKGIDADISDIISDIENNKYTEAVYKLPKITDEYPNYYLGYYLTGVVMSALEQDSNAIMAFEKSLSLNPNDFESYASLGQLYYSEAEKMFSSDAAKKSIANFDKAIALNPDCYIYHYYKGLNYLLMGDNKQAIDCFDIAIGMKNTDYNSMYYKAIAQYLQKDYENVISETTKLLFRRVSNYNSVLFLRALAYYKLNDFENSVADIEKIHNNMDDIYNVDIRKLSRKEQTLESYLYYLQALLAKANGLGAKSDMQKAFQNPLIAILSTKGNEIDAVDIKVAYEDIDTQYDYMRTVFDDLGISFEYLNPDYKIVSIKNKQETIAENTQSGVVESVETVINQEEDLVKEETASDLEVKDILAGEKNLLSEVKDILSEENQLVEKIEQKSQDIEEINKKVENIIESKSLLQKADDEVFLFDSDTIVFKDSENDEPKQDIMRIEDILSKLSQKADSQADTVVENVVSKSNHEELKDETIKIEQEVKQVEDEIIKTADNVNTAIDKVQQQLTDNQVPKTVTEVSTSPAVADTVIKIKPVETLIAEAKAKNSINEKYATVDMTEFDVKNNKAPIINDDDEVIVFEPKSFIQQAEEQLTERIKANQKVEKAIEKNPEVVIEETPNADVANISSSTNEVETVNVNITPTDEELKIPQKEAEKTIEIIAPEKVEIPVIREFKAEDSTPQEVSNKVFEDNIPETLKELSSEELIDVLESQNPTIDMTPAITELEMDGKKSKKVKKEKKSKKEKNNVLDTIQEEHVITEAEVEKNVKDTVDNIENNVSESIEDVKQEVTKKEKKLKEKKNSEIQKIEEKLAPLEDISEANLKEELANSELPNFDIEETSEKEVVSSVDNNNVESINEECVEDKEKAKSKKVKEEKPKKGFSLKNLFSRKKSVITPETAEDLSEDK